LQDSLERRVQNPRRDLGDAEKVARNPLDGFDPGPLARVAIDGAQQVPPPVDRGERLVDGGMTQEPQAQMGQLRERRQQRPAQFRFAVARQVVDEQHDARLGLGNRARCLRIETGQHRVPWIDAGPGAFPVVENDHEQQAARVAEVHCIAEDSLAHRPFAGAPVLEQDTEAHAGPQLREVHDVGDEQAQIVAVDAFGALPQALPRDRGGNSLVPYRPQPALGMPRLAEGVVKQVVMGVGHRVLSPSGVANPDSCRIIAKHVRQAAIEARRVE